MSIRMQKRRVVHGVTLQRTAPDVWSANGWSFQCAEGAYLAGVTEWRAYDDQGRMTIHMSLGGAVRAMLIATRDIERTP